MTDIFVEKKKTNKLDSLASNRTQSFLFVRISNSDIAIRNWMNVIRNLFDLTRYSKRQLKLWGDDVGRAETRMSIAMVYRGRVESSKRKWNSNARKHQIQLGHRMVDYLSLDQEFIEIIRRPINNRNYITVKLAFGRWQIGTELKLHNWQARKAIVNRK